jgi:hypothetical protein
MGSPISKKERRKNRNNGGGSQRPLAAQPGFANQKEDGEDGWGAGRSMGAVLQTLIAPYEKVAHAEGKYDHLFQLGALAWNIAMLPEADAPALVQQAVDAARSQDPDTLKAIMMEMVGRARRARKAG